MIGRIAATILGLNAAVLALLAFGAARARWKWKKPDFATLPARKDHHRPNLQTLNSNLLPLVTLECPHCGAPLPKGLHTLN